MKTTISLLRGINVSGQNRINMPELIRLYETLGMTNVVTYIQSGNVVFDTEINDQAKIINLIEVGISQSFGGEVRVILRDKHELGKILKSNPFLASRNEDSNHLYVTFLSDIPSEVVINNLTSPHPIPRPSSTPHGVDTAVGSLKPPQLGMGENNIPDEFIIRDNEVYLFCPIGYGKTKFSNTFFEKKLNVTATTRNWKTVNALFEIAERR
jgi:uncharacterized protein (DUF1697 family)